MLNLPQPMVRSGTESYRLTRYQSQLVLILIRQALRKLSEPNGYTYQDHRWVSSEPAPHHVTENLLAVQKVLESSNALP